MNTKLDRVEIPRWSVPMFRKSQFNLSARKCPDQNPTQLRMMYTNILPIPPPRTRWKMAPYKVAIRPPKINVGKAIGSQFTRWKLVCQRRCDLFLSHSFLGNNEGKTCLAWLAVNHYFAPMCINNAFRDS